MPKLLITNTFDLDMLMACRYAYYVKSINIVPDQTYDEMEKEYELLYGRLPVGSDKAKDYSDAQRALALYFMLSGRVTAVSNNLL
jgi:NAD-dependent DNA ligase